MRWLLLLGAEARYQASLDTARVQLAALGGLQPLTQARLTDASDGSGRRYCNQLVSLAHDGSRSAVVDACKRIERALGRGALDGVPLDIDLLAHADDTGWRADEDAIAKREFDTAHVRALLEEAELERLLVIG
jgi:7,8-dihydro-6-hydroxymethylpterin-pyrophosphokinase